MSVTGWSACQVLAHCQPVSGTPPLKFKFFVPVQVESTKQGDGTWRSLPSFLDGWPDGQAPPCAHPRELGSRSSLGARGVQQLEVTMMPTAELLVVETTRSAPCGPKQLSTKRSRRKRKAALRSQPTGESQWTAPPPDRGRALPLRETQAQPTRPPQVQAILA